MDLCLSVVVFRYYNRKRKTKKGLDYFHLTKEFFGCTGTMKGDRIKLAV
jgi:hypothetical protein